MSGFKISTESLRPEFYQVVIALTGGAGTYPTADGNDNGAVCPQDHSAFTTKPTTLAIGRRVARAHQRFLAIVENLSKYADAQIQDVQFTSAGATAADNQPSVEIHVLQGERPMAKDNRSLGRFHLDGIMPSPRGIPQIEVTLDIDANGILSVSAKDKATGKENKIRIEGGSQLSKEEIERMKREAAENAEADKIERERIDKLNQADAMIFQTEKQIKEFGDKLTEENTTELNACLDTLKSAHSDQNLEEIDSAMNKLNEAWQRISTDLYNRSSQEEASQATGTEGGDTGEPQDVQFEEVK